MTRTFRACLGSSSLPGKQGIDHATRFKAQLRSLQRKPDTATLLTVVSAEAPHASVVALYDADDSEAVAWVTQAEAVSAELWQKMNERRKGASK